MDLDGFYDMHSLVLTCEPSLRKVCTQTELSQLCIFPDQIVRTPLTGKSNVWWNRFTGQTKEQLDHLNITVLTLMCARTHATTKDFVHCNGPFRTVESSDLKIYLLKCPLFWFVRFIFTAQDKPLMAKWYVGEDKEEDGECVTHTYKRRSTCVTESVHSKHRSRYLTAAAAKCTLFLPPGCSTTKGTVLHTHHTSFISFPLLEPNRKSKAQRHHMLPFDSSFWS